MTIRPDRSRSPFSAVARALRRLVRPRYKTELETPPAISGGQKLQPIAEVLARTGREPPTPD